MPQIRLRVKLNKGKKGIALDKLEKFVAESRRFLQQAGEDLGIGGSSELWVGVEFENGSLAWTSQTATAVPPAVLFKFNESVMGLSRSEYPKYLQETTADHFFSMTAVLDPSEIADIAVYDADNAPVWLEISRNTGLLARQQNVLPYRHSQGSVQGTIHALFKEAREPYFNLRELSSGSLVKCLYQPDDYAAIVRALEIREQVVHVRGAVVTDTHQRSIHHVTVQNIVLAEPYDFSDVEKFLRANRSQ